MELIKELNVSAEYFYGRVMESVLYDIRQHTEKSMSKDQLSGFSYSKQFAPKSSGKIIITEILENQVYAFKTITSRNEFDAKYVIDAIDETHCPARA